MTRVRHRSLRALSIEILGTVQGVGFRPFLFRLAADLGLVGRIANSGRGVLLELEGPHSALEEFRARLRNEAPAAASIKAVRIVPALPSGFDSIRIELCLTEKENAESPWVPVAPDLSPCSDCMRELQTKDNRRFRYPFISCSACGPRYSILHQIPYERKTTALRDFPLCRQCLAEYEDPRNRRFHAESICCPQCGPQVRLVDHTGSATSQREAAIKGAAQILAAGGIVALKGVGGYQLLADATNTRAVEELRRRKGRPAKPFALLARNMEAARSICRTSPEEERALSSSRAPIVLLRKKGNAAPVCEQVAPGNPRLGVMLPGSPLHALVAEGFSQPLVATSGNRSGEPLAYTNEEARSRLKHIADAFLEHNRDIVRPLDDSVIFTFAKQDILLRRARGYAPLPCALRREQPDSESGPPESKPVAKPTVLAVGAHLKNTVALAVAGDVHCSAHIGDLDTTVALAQLRSGIAEQLARSRSEVRAIACDLHPDYASTREAERMARRIKRPLFAVQHHHAHAMAILYEHDMTETELVATWDGSGLGPDKTLWGGEFLATDPLSGTARRVASLLPFRLPGGAAAFRDVRRSAFGVLHEAKAAFALPALTAQEVRLWTRLVSEKVAIQTSSVGRLFDAIAGILGLAEHISFEGEAALLLQSAAEEAEDAPTVTLATPQITATSDPVLVLQPELLASNSARDVNPHTAGRESPHAAPHAKEISQQQFLLLDWRPTLHDLLDRLARGEPVGSLARAFHESMAQTIIATTKALGYKRVAVTGGCFQNALLLQMLLHRATEQQLEVILPSMLPPGDGAIAVGQAATVAALMATGAV